MQRWIVSEMYRRNWREVGICPAENKDKAIATIRRYGMRPKDRPMKAAKLVVTKR